MQNPFPGMNPYLEQPGLWPQGHNRLIVAIADTTTPQVAPKYRVSIEERIDTTTDPFPLVGIAAVAVAQRGKEQSVVPATTQLTAPPPSGSSSPAHRGDRALFRDAIGTDQCCGLRD
jgi:hypothetical protein